MCIGLLNIGMSLYDCYINSLLEFINHCLELNNFPDGLLGSGPRHSAAELRLIQLTMTSIIEGPVVITLAESQMETF